VLVYKILNDFYEEKSIKELIYVEKNNARFNENLMIVSSV